MSEKISILQHKGKKIIYIDFEGLKEKEILDLFDESQKIQIKEKINLVIVNAKNTVTTNSIKERMAQDLKEIESKIGKTYSVVLGLRLSQQIIANLLKPSQHFTSDIDDAKEWLVKKG